MSDTNVIEFEMFRSVMAEVLMKKCKHSKLEAYAKAEEIMELMGANELSELIDKMLADVNGLKDDQKISLYEDLYEEKY